MLRFYALRPGEPESRVLQDDGFVTVSEHVAGGADYAASANNRRAGYFPGTASPWTFRGIFLPFCGSTAFSPATLHTSFLLLALIRF